MATYDTDAILAASSYVPELDAEITVREYLKALLVRLWEEADGFSGKRPFGNSGWTSDMAPGLIKAGLVEGTFDENGYLDEVGDEYDAMMLAAIRALK